MRHATETITVLAEIGVRFGRAAAVGHVEARQRSHPVEALGITQRLVVRSLEVGVRQNGLADEGLVVAGPFDCRDMVPLGVPKTDLPVI